MVNWLCPGWGGGGHSNLQCLHMRRPQRKKEKKGCFLRMNANALHVGLKSYCSDEEQVIFLSFFFKFSSQRCEQMNH